MSTFLKWNFYGNPLLDWATALALIFLSLFIFAIFKKFLSKRLTTFLNNHFSEAGRLTATVFAQTKWGLLVFVSIYIGAQQLALPGKTVTIIKGLFTAALCLQAAIWIQAFLKGWFDSFLDRKGREDASAVPALSLLGFALRVGTWVTIILLALDNLGVNITALVAGLGVGGIAVALAAQKILEDLFASLSIVLDKPFVTGDLIVVGDITGTVEHIGLKTTRLRSISGELLVCANADLLQSRIRNYKRMSERRVAFVVRVSYETPIKKLRLIPGFIADAVAKQSKARFDHAHFLAYGDFSINFEGIYFVLDRKYNAYMTTHEAVCLELFDRLSQEGISFAYTPAPVVKTIL